MQGRNTYTKEHVLQLVIPIVRFCLKYGIKVQVLIEVVKQAYVLAAETELRKTNVRTNSNRISLASGLHRKDVERIKSGVSNKRAYADVITRLIGQWKNDRRFCNAPGQPKVLSHDGKKGKFAQLVFSVSRELNPYSVLIELERLSFVKRTSDGIELLKSEYVLEEDIELTFEMVGQDIADLIEAVEQNIVDDSENVPSLHLTTRYDNIPPEYMDKIRKWLVLEGQRLHHKARNFLSKYDKDLNPTLWKKQGGGKVVVGTFGFTEFFSDQVNNEN